MSTQRNLAPGMKTERKLARSGRRRGTIYAIVLLSSLLVATIGVSALQLIRLQSRMAADNNDFIAARAYARAAIDLGMLKIKSDQNWRVNLGNGYWASDKPIDSGTYSLSASDPVDDNVTSGEDDPVVLTGIGKKGSAIFKVSTRLEVGPHAGSCLEVAMISGKSTTLSNAALTADQSVSANKAFTASTSTVNADVEAFGQISGSTYTKATLQTTAARDMPDSAHALDYYLANGTTISYTALNLWNDTNLVTNSDFESNTTGWYISGFLASVSRSGTAFKTGSNSLRTSRLFNTSVAATDLPVASLKCGHTYRVSIPFFTGGTGTVQGTLTLTSGGEGTQVFSTPSFAVPANTWVNITGDITPTWTGSLSKATLSTTTSFSSAYHIDTVSVTDITYSKGEYVMEGKLLSPTSNPYGSTNPQGIYVIDCGGKDVVVGRSRIVGTLVFLNPGPKSAVSKAVSLEPAVYNFPILLSSQRLTVNLDPGGLSETSVGVNFNPTGTPYPYQGGTVNATLTDSYPSKINGLVYTVDKLKFTGTSSVSGIVISETDIELTTATLQINYSNTYLTDPPPGFDVGTTEMQVDAGTWQRSVN